MLSRLCHSKCHPLIDLYLSVVSLAPGCVLTSKDHCGTISPIIRLSVLLVK